MLSVKTDAEKAARAELRFRLDSHAIRRHGLKAMAWRTDVRALLERGVLARRELHNCVRSLARPEARQPLIQELERVVDALSRADDWTRRLQAMLDRLRPAGRNAFSKLVKLGCVPDPLAECADLQLAPDSSVGSTTETANYRPRLVALTEQIEALADECEKYLGLEWRYAGSKYPLDPTLALYLRSEAAFCREFIRDTDPRRRGTRTRADFVLLRTMDEIRTITGQYQDGLFSQLLEGALGKPRGAGALTRWRSREQAKWGQWQMPTRITQRRSVRFVRA